MQRLVSAPAPSLIPKASLALSHFRRRSDPLLPPTDVKKSSLLAGKSRYHSPGQIAPSRRQPLVEGRYPATPNAVLLLSPQFCPACAFADLQAWWTRPRARRIPRSTPVIYFFLCFCFFVLFRFWFGFFFFLVF